MNTKLIMTASALTLGAAGVSFTFIPEEILKLLQSEVSRPLILLIQISGALYFAFAMLNWMSRNGTIGGIYNKPIATANFTHFLIGGLALVKGIISNHRLPYAIWGIAAIYIFFAIAFTLINFRNPSGSTKKV